MKNAIKKFLEIVGGILICGAIIFIVAYFTYLEVSVKTGMIHFFNK